tara:strand:+ start:55532 stop:56143 length:612 start_codon:yes stop_codon:yes gene_type:complete
MESLVLNRFWIPVDTRSVQDAITAMNSSKGPHTLALDLDYELNDDGTPIFSQLKNCNPVYWDEWEKLPIRNWDVIIKGAKKDYRVPLITISENYEEIPMVFFRPTSNRIFKRDKNICQYTNQKLTKKELSIDHVIPKAKGGDRFTWENQVTCHRNLNSKKGDRLNEELGLKLIRKPFAPKKVPSSANISIKNEMWRSFFKSND